MKKSLLVITLFILLATTPIFAATTDSFTVTANVTGIDVMKIATATYSGTTLATFNALTSFTSHTITGGGNQTSLNAWLTTLSNNRAGFKVTMKAEAMKSAVTGQGTAYINYTVTCNGKSVTTNNGTAVSAQDPVVTYNSLSQVTSTSNKISLSVNQTDFDKALAGSYTGTVTFTYTAN